MSREARLERRIARSCEGEAADGVEPGGVKKNDKRDGQMR